MLIRRRHMVWSVLGLVAAALGYAVFVKRPQMQPRALVASGYMARVACACVFIGGRTLDSCLTDKEAGMELVQVAVDSQRRRVTASVPLLASVQASHTPGLGCVLER